MIPSLGGSGTASGTAESDSGREGREVNEACRAFLGLPVELMLCFAATSNLAAVEDSEMDREEAERRGRGIEKALRDWRPNPPDAEALADEGAFVTAVVTQELWRHVCFGLLFFFFISLNDQLTTPVTSHRRP